MRYFSRKFNISLGAFIAVVSRLMLFCGLWIISRDVRIEKGLRHIFDMIHLFAVRWDGNSYTFIAQNWYVTQGSEQTFIVFPPFYPITIAAVNLIVNNYVWAGFVISTVCFVIACVLMHKLAGSWATILMAFFPTTFFFSTAYPESLFVMLVLICMLSASKKNFWVAGVAAFFATLTRPFGVLLAFYLIVEIYSQKFSDREKIKYGVWCLICVGLGGLIYLGINYFIYGNPFAFQVYLRDNWYKSFAFPWESIQKSWQWDNFISGKMEAVTATIAIVLIPVAFRILKFSEATYYSLAVIMFTSTNFLLSGPRYLLSIPPFFMMVAKLTDYKILREVVIFGSVVIMFALSKMYLQGMWVY